MTARIFDPAVADVLVACVELVMMQMEFLKKNLALLLNECFVDCNIRDCLFVLSICLDAFACNVTLGLVYNGLWGQFLLSPLRSGVQRSLVVDKI